MTTYMTHIMLKTFFIGFLLTLAMLFFTPQVSTAYISNNVYYGTTVDFISFEEVNETDESPQLGSPFYISSMDSLSYFPSYFHSLSAEGSANTTTGTFNLMVEAKEGFVIDRLIFNEFGFYSLIGAGDAEAKISGLLTVTPINGGETVTDFFSQSYGIPEDSSGMLDANWELDFTNSQIPLLSVMISFNSILETSSTEGTVAFIQSIYKTVNVETSELDAFIYPVPLPGAIWLFGSAFCAAIGIRRFKTGKITDR